MKAFSIFVLVTLFILISTTVCYAEVIHLSEFEAYEYNEIISRNYKIHVYDNPFGNFIEREDGLCEKDGVKGEYKYLGYNFHEKEITNDRHFRDTSLIGNVFEDYEGVEWDDLSPSSWTSWGSVETNSILIDFLLNTKFYDSDHITKAETDTGYTIWDLLGPDYRRKSVLMTTPERGSAANIYLHYGDDKYNSVLIYPTTSIHVTISCTPDIAAIPKNQTRDVNITIDTTESYWTSAGIEYEDFTSYRYWAGAGSMEESGIQERDNGIYTYRVKDVSPNTTINIWCEAISGDLEFFGFDYRKEAVASIFIGEETYVPGAYQYFLDYNILSRKINRTLPQSKATLTKDSDDWWVGSASGSLGVTNGNPGLLGAFSVTNNPVISGSYETEFTRQPVINTTVQRSSLGDDPVNHHYANNGVLSATGGVSFSGSVRRRYGYTSWGCQCKEDPVTKVKYCGGHTGYSTAIAYFTELTEPKTGKVNLEIITRIYNGKDTIPLKSFDDKIEYNTPEFPQKNLFWTGEKYDFNVIRWMYHQDESNNLNNATKVDSQYTREFRQQCSAVVKWDVVNKMEDDYERSREAARSMDYRKEEYDKAVFASDRDLRGIDYPIKSGYYFNPTGEYTFTVETVTWKQTQDDTEEHKDLVDAVTKAFRYESDLMYINSSKQAVNILNEPLPPDGNSYGKRAASLTAENPTGVNGMVLLEVIDRSDEESRYVKTVEEIQHSDAVGGYTDVLFKEILEGYSESGTENSETLYRYKEYIKDGQKMYKITEKTTVTIKINPDNNPVYTHAHMPDGDYRVRVWVDSISLSDIGHYGALNVLSGTSLDDIEITVKGSMYDDVY